MILTLICLLTVLCVWNSIRFHYRWADTSKSRFKTGERVLVITKYADSVCHTGGHAPYFAEIIRVRRHHEYKFEYDMIYDDGELEEGLFEHNLEGPTISTRPSIVHTLNDLSKL